MLCCRTPTVEPAADAAVSRSRTGAARAALSCRFQLWRRRVTFRWRAVRQDQGTVGEVAQRVTPAAQPLTERSAR